MVDSHFFSSNDAQKSYSGDKKETLDPCDIDRDINIIINHTSIII